MEFKVKNIFITGANRGIGLALTKEMLKEFQPDHLFATYRNPETSQELLSLSSIHSNLHTVELDVIDYSKLPEIIKQVDDVTNGTGINLLINNSGILGHDCKGIRDITRQDLMSHLETNTVAPVMITQAFLPLVQKAATSNASEPISICRAAIINVSTKMASISDNSSGGAFSYRVTKTALNMATKCISLDLKNTGITSVLLHPGWVKTDMGGEKAPLTTEDSVLNLVKTLRALTEDHNGKFISYNGDEIAW